MQIYKEYNMNFIIFLLFPKKKKKNYIHFLKTAPPRDLATYLVLFCQLPFY